MECWISGWTVPNREVTEALYVKRGCGTQERMHVSVLVWGRGGRILAGDGSPINKKNRHEAKNYLVLLLLVPLLPFPNWRSQAADILQPRNINISFNKNSNVPTSDCGKLAFFGIYIYNFDNYYFSFCTRTVTCWYKPTFSLP